MGCMVSENELDPRRMDFEKPETAEKLWDAFYNRLRLSVRDRVRSIRRSSASESEVALSAMNSFIVRARDGQYPDLANEQEMWRLLKTIAIRKANDLRKNLRAQKRGGGHAIWNQRELAGDKSLAVTGVEAAASSGNAPEVETELSDLFNSLLEQLPDERHRDVILLKLQGASVVMIAEYLGTTTRTVQRMIKRMEDDWQVDFLG